MEDTHHSVSFDTGVSTVSAPLIAPRRGVGNGFGKVSSIFSGILSFVSNIGKRIFKGRGESSSFNSDSFEKRSFGGPEKAFTKKRFITLGKGILAIFAVLAIAYGLTHFPKIGGTSSNSSKTAVNAPLKATDIYKQFQFPILDAKGKEVTRLNYEIETAELRDEIVVQGQKATAIKGRLFLIINLKIVNPYQQPVALNARDFVRLSVNGNKNDQLAPEIHNDPVEIQAISTKKARLGFPVSESDKDLILQVGQIEGEKQEIELFK